MYFLYDASSKNILLTLVLVLAFVFFLKHRIKHLIQVEDSLIRMHFPLLCKEYLMAFLLP